MSATALNIDCPNCTERNSFAPESIELFTDDDLWGIYRFMCVHCHKEYEDWTSPRTSQALITGGIRHSRDPDFIDQKDVVPPDLNSLISLAESERLVRAVYKPWFLARLIAESGCEL